MPDKEKQYKTEWSFSFEKLGASLDEMVGSLTGDEELKEETFIAGKDGATSANINIHFAVGRNNITALTNSDNLFEADLRYVGEVKFSVEGDAEKTVTLRQDSRFSGVKHSIKRAFGSSRDYDLEWNIRLSPDVPLDLKIHSGVGKSELDLAGLQIANLDFHAGTGETIVTLPQSQVPYNANFREGVGATTITVPQQTSLNLDIQSGVGEVKVKVSGDTAVRINGTSGLGSLDVPSHYKRVEGGEDFISKRGVWQSPNFEDAEHQVVINYKGGVGSFKLSSDVTVV